jgi:hypothetical protein
MHPQPPRPWSLLAPIGAVVYGATYVVIDPDMGPFLVFLAWDVLITGLTWLTLCILVYRKQQRLYRAQQGAFLTDDDPEP